MCLETADISYTKTGSELLALLLASSEITAVSPKFNEVKKRARETIGLFTYEDQKGIIHLGYNRLKLVPNAILKY